MKKVLARRLSSGVAALAVLGAVVSPVVANAATTSGNTAVTATVNAAISLTTSSTVAIGLTPGASAVVSSASDTVSVSTNNSAGYTLTFADSDATTTLVDGANSIAAHAGTFGTPTALATNSWGYRVVGVGGFTGSAYSAETNATSSTSTWAGVPATGAPATLKTTAAPGAGDTTTVWYGVKVDATQPTGAYTDTVTYTAVTN